MAEKKIELVVFDLAGTTVDDTIDGLPLVTVAMKEAFASCGIDISPDQVNKYRGLDKKDALNHLIKESLERNEKQHENMHCTVDDLFIKFKSALNSHLMDINQEIKGTSLTFSWLKSQDVKIALGSGFPHNVVISLVEKLGWNDVADYVSSAENEGHGRPHPSLIHSAMKYCSVSNIRSVVKVGDTIMDIEEGKNAGCWTVAVLTGTQTESTLKQSNPDYIIPSVEHLPSIFEIFGRNSIRA